MRLTRSIPLAFWLLLSAGATLAAGASQADAPRQSSPLGTVHVRAPRLLYGHRLEGLAMRFVRSHAVPSAAIDQLGRWHEPVCPLTRGLEPAFDERVSRRIVAVAEAVGAPTLGPGKRCEINIEVVFTPDPQGLLNRIARRFPALLGSSRLRHPVFQGAIESWYVTGTRSVSGWNPPAPGMGGSQPMDLPIHPEAPSPFVLGVVPDDTAGGVSPNGLAGSHLTAGLDSELLHVLIIADAHEVSGYPLRAIADYVAVLALTHMQSLETCEALPSIIDLLASRCGGQAKPAGITPEDTAYLRALYSSDLEMNLNIEQVDVRDRMVSAIEGR